MNQNRPKIKLSQALNGFRITCDARQLSEHTITDYFHTLERFRAFFEDDPFVEDISHHEIEKFLLSYNRLSKKTILNYHTNLSALWSWLMREDFVSEHVVRKVPAPKPEIREIVPFTEQEVKAMLASLHRSRRYSRPGKAVSDHAIPHAERNRAIILLLLDTGVRASELCELKIHQVDKRNLRIHVMGKGSKERYIPFSSVTGQALWRYLTTREEEHQSEYVFVTSSEGPLSRHRLAGTLRRIAGRAGVDDVHPHRFRHTFAIQYLRNGGDPYTLQKLLGHSTLDMVRRYLALAQIDLDNAHRRASPVGNWRL